MRFLLFLIISISPYVYSYDVTLAETIDLNDNKLYMVESGFITIVYLVEVKSEYFREYQVTGYVAGRSSYAKKSGFQLEEKKFEGRLYILKNETIFSITSYGKTPSGCSLHVKRKYIMNSYREGYIWSLSAYKDMCNSIEVRYCQIVGCYQKWRKGESTGAYLFKDSSEAIDYFKSLQ